MDKGTLYTVKIFLYDREIEILKKYDFTEEIFKINIPQEEHYILNDLCSKGFIQCHYNDDKIYYHKTNSYLQHFT